MKISQAKWTRIRVALLMTGFVLVFAVVMWRALELQVLEREKLASIADRESHRVIKLDPVRGDIFDRRGEKLAVSLKTDSVFVHPTQVNDPDSAARQLAKILGLDAAHLAKTLKEKDSFTFIKRQITPGQVEKIKALKLSGIGFVDESKRYYPNNLLAAHLLGFVGVDSRGLEGLELGYDKYLRGGIIEWRVKRDALGRTYLGRDTNAPKVDRGHDVHLTIDRRIQYITEQALGRAVKTYGAKGGQALVIRPQTGEILAAAVEPGFNPNVFNRYSASARRNKILTDTFDPGSTFKVFVVAGALEEGRVRPEDKIFCENGSLVIDKHTINDHHPYGTLTVANIIKHSSNIGALKIGDKLGSEKLYDYLRRFNFGQTTGIDFPGESPGMLRPYKKWRRLDAANVAFGQGISVTGLQMAMAMSALANDGVLMEPYIVNRIVDEGGRRVFDHQPSMIRRVVSERTALEVKKMLREVCTEGGTGVRADSPSYPAAGKTGTAQKIDPDTRSYSKDQFFSSFLGFIPYPRAELVIFVGLDEPHPQIYGGTVAAPVFREIAEQALPLLNVPPVPESQHEGDDGSRLLTAENETPTPTKPSPVKHSNRLSVKIDPETMVEVRALAREIAASETAFADTAVVGETALVKNAVLIEPDPRVMPDLRGLSMRRVMDLMSKYNVDVAFSGSGLAVWQKPEAGRPLASGQTCQVRFEQW